MVVALLEPAAVVEARPLALSVTGSACAARRHAQQFRPAGHPIDAR
jgi:hypothetical protein